MRCHITEEVILRPVIDVLLGPQIITAMVKEKHGCCEERMVEMRAKRTKVPAEVGEFRDAVNEFFGPRLFASSATPATRSVVRLRQSFFSWNLSEAQMSKSMLVMRGAAVCSALLAFAALAGCAPEKPLLNQSLAWTPTHQLNLGATQNVGTPATVRFETFTDSAQNPALVGENVEHAKPRLVTTIDSVGQFVSRHLANLFVQAGYVSGGANAARIVSGQVSKFFVREHNMYRATVVLHLTVSDRGGKVLWRGTVWGSNKTFGRSYQLYNYNQVLSDAVVNAADNLLKNSALHEALARR